MDTSVVSAATATWGGMRRGALSLDDPGGAPIIYTANRFGYDIVSPDYFRTMGYPIVRGRDFSPGEFGEASVIVDETLARHLWRGADPIGRLIKLDSAHGARPWLKVVGIVRVSETYFNADRDGVRKPGR